MSKKDEKKYKVTSPISTADRRYEVGEFILLDDEAAEGLHVELVEQPEVKAEETEPKASAKKEETDEKAAEEIPAEPKVEETRPKATAKKEASSPKK